MIFSFWLTRCGWNSYAFWTPYHCMKCIVLQAAWKSIQSCPSSFVFIVVFVYYYRHWQTIKHGRHIQYDEQLWLLQMHNDRLYYRIIDKVIIFFNKSLWNWNEWNEWFFWSWNSFENAVLNRRTIDIICCVFFLYHGKISNINQLVVYVVQNQQWQY